MRSRPKRELPEPQLQTPQEPKEQEMLDKLEAAFPMERRNPPVLPSHTTRGQAMYPSPTRHR